MPMTQFQKRKLKKAAARTLNQLPDTNTNSDFQNVADLNGNVFQFSSNSNVTMASMLQGAANLNVIATDQNCVEPLTDIYNSNRLYCQLMGNSDFSISGCGNMTESAHQTAKELENMATPICATGGPSQLANIASAATGGVILIVFLAFFLKKRCYSVRHDVERDRLAPEEKNANVGHDMKPASSFSFAGLMSKFSGYSKASGSELENVEMNASAKNGKTTEKEQKPGSHLGMSNSINAL